MKNLNLHVCFISRKWPPAVGGMETYSLKLCEALKEKTQLWTLVLPGKANGMPPGLLQLVFFGVSVFFKLLFNRKKLDVVHVGDMASWALAIPVLIRGSEVNILISAHGTDVAFQNRKGMPARLYKLYLKFGVMLLSRKAMIIANSTATKEKVQAIGFEHIHVVPLATDISVESIQDIKPNTIFFAGRLIPRKGLKWFVDNVLDALPENFVLDAAGTVWDVEEKKSLEHPRVNFLGALNTQQIAAAYQSALCVIVPNIRVDNGEYEGFGLVATEASACRAIVLAADIDGLKEALVDGVTGFHLPSGEADAWVKKIMEISKWHQEERENFINNSLAYVTEYYTWDRVCDDCLKLY